MATAPGWMTLTIGPTRTEGGRLVVKVNVRVRRWHPGYWWARFRGWANERL